MVSFCDRTDVEFYAMTEEEINGYLALEKEGRLLCGRIRLEDTEFRPCLGQSL